MPTPRPAPKTEYPAPRLQSNDFDELHAGAILASDFRPNCGLLYYPWQPLESITHIFSYCTTGLQARLQETLCTMSEQPRIFFYYRQFAAVACRLDSNSVDPCTATRW